MKALQVRTHSKRQPQTPYTSYGHVVECNGCWPLSCAAAAPTSSALLLDQKQFSGHADSAQSKVPTEGNHSRPSAQKPNGEDQESCPTLGDILLASPGCDAVDT
jgi:hypothetical protein